MWIAVVRARWIDEKMMVALHRAHCPVLCSRFCGDVLWREAALQRPTPATRHRQRSKGGFPVDCARTHRLYRALYCTGGCIANTSHVTCTQRAHLFPVRSLLCPARVLHGSHAEQFRILPASPHHAPTRNVRANAPAPSFPAMSLTTALLWRGCSLMALAPMT